MRVLTVPEACKLLKISRPTLYKLIDENKLVAKKIGNRWRISYKSIIDYIEEDKKIIESMLVR